MHTRRRKKKDVEFSNEMLVRGNNIDPKVKKEIDKKIKNDKINKQLNNSSGQGEIPDRRL
ncbi:hypothetical protein KHQ82_05110 [Mycoplasmatota bacterium]|nr:hypothetical protein KHQ82_05110 [Mycoplasmatota bacterium]